MGFNGTQNLPQPYQSFGARCVVNLASRLMTALLPPGQNFFRLTVPPQPVQCKSVQLPHSAQVSVRGMAGNPLDESDHRLELLPVKRLLPLLCLPVARMSSIGVPRVVHIAVQLQRLDQQIRLRVAQRIG